MYQVVKDFTDLEDNRYVYRAGDEFPRSGFSVSEKRLKVLSTAKNNHGEPLIIKIAEEVPEVKEEKKKPNKRKTKKPKE